MNNLKLVLGGPGCGKTTRLLEIVAREMEAGVPSTEIAFVTFTKAAAEEAKRRAADKFHLDPEDDMPWFRTIHSLAYARLGITREEILNPVDWREFAGLVGEPLTGQYDSTDAPVVAGGQLMGDLLLRISDYAATTLMPLDEAWHFLNEPMPWFRLKRFVDTLASYKADCGKMDFTDLLHQYIETGEPVPVTVAVIDEAQDLTAAQWGVVKRAFRDAARVYVGGDDDQAIYHWAGADVPQFLQLSEAPEILPISHRLPREIHALATQVAGRIRFRYAKRFSPDATKEGHITWHQHAEGIDFTAPGSWFLLARNTYMLAHLEAHVRSLGMNYARRSGPAVSQSDVKTMQTWERLRNGKQPNMSAAEARSLAKLLDQPKPQTKELQRYTLQDFGWDVWSKLPWFEALRGLPTDKRAYYLECLRRGEKLTQPPRIQIETIHGVKGAEADHVVLMTDMSRKTIKSFRANEDAEHRVFYVGVTRAKRSLHLIMPQSDQSYPLHHVT